MVPQQKRLGKFSVLKYCLKSEMKVTFKINTEYLNLVGTSSTFRGFRQNTQYDSMVLSQIEINKFQ